MRCPKCGYVSFDYNQVCPKCTKDVSAEQAKLNLFAFRPDPPSLLGALTGEANESNVGLRMGTAAALGEVSHDVDIGLDDSSVMETGELGVDESQDLDIAFDAEGLGELGEEIADGCVDGRQGGVFIGGRACDATVQGGSIVTERIGEDGTGHQ